MRDPASLTELEGLLDQMLEYHHEVVNVTGHARWLWRVHPRVYSELRKISGRREPSSEPAATLFGVPIVVAPTVDDVELWKVGGGRY